MDAFPLDANDLCTVCRESQINFDVAYSFGSFEGPLQRLIHIFKYSKVETLADPLGELLLRALPLERKFDCVIPMPMHWRKKWQRGFNQAELLARPVARRYGLTLAHNLIRRRHTAAQAGLNEREREKNLRGVFEVRRPDQLRDKRVLVVDDVFTTGASLRAAAEALKKAGVEHVSVLTLARVDRRIWQPKFASAERAEENVAPIARAS